MKVKDRKIIDVHDFNDLVTSTYGKPYNFQQQDGCKPRGIFWFTLPCVGEDYPNDSIPEEVNGDKMGVSFEAWKTRDPKAPVGEDSEGWMVGLFWERNFYPDVDMILEDLNNKGLLEDGEYGINIDW